jgi:hypothetical protein
MNKANNDIKTLAKSKGIHMWQIAERYGLHEGNFSRLLRHPLSDSDRSRIITIINQLAEAEV